MASPGETEILYDAQEVAPEEEDDRCRTTP